MYLANKTLLQGGRYKIDRHISSGGFGNTYEAIHTVMGSKVAIKEFFPKMFCNRDENTSHVTVATNGNRELVDKLRKKFNEEAKAVFQMNHPNIVRVLDIFEENGTAYYVMEYIDGKSLNEISKERGALPEAEAVGYIRQIADALKYVHSLNRLHLDIKPGNIMVDKNGKAILIDFGASKHYDDESGENTSTLMGVNTKGYAPIEQSTQSFTSFSPATDIYSLGATLYKMLTGNTPPDANLLMAEEEILKPLPGKVSEPTRKAVMSAMTLRRKGRPQDIDSFLSLLDAGVTVTNDEETICEVEAPKLATSQSIGSAPKSGTSVSDSRKHIDDRDKPVQKRTEKPNSNSLKYLIWTAAVVALIITAVLGITIPSRSVAEEETVVYVTGQTFQDIDGKAYTYTGETLNGLPNGQGTGIYPYGTYAGPYKNGYMHGANGQFIEKGGAVFVGTFANDFYLEGTLTRTDGTYFVGTMKDGVPSHGAEYYKNGKINKEF